METLSPEVLDASEAPDADLPTLAPEYCELSRAEAHALAQMLDDVYQSDRRQLYEHEVLPARRTGRCDLTADPSVRTGR